MDATPRSLSITLLAWAIIVGGLVLTPVSFISLLMVLAGSPGTGSAHPLEASLVLLGPALSVVAGIGLLRRKRWAWWLVVAALACVLALDAWTLVRGPIPERTFVSASGVRTTVLATGTGNAAPSVAVCAVLLALLAHRRRRGEFPPSAAAAPGSAPVPGWRVGHQGRDRMYYEEWLDGAWQRIDIDGEMLTGEAHHAVYLAAPGRWQAYPAWARDRRDEIVARIRSQFSAPGYVYSGDAAAPGPPPMPAADAADARRPVLASRPGAGYAGPLAAVLLLALAAGMFWLVYSGLDRGQTLWPAKVPSRQHEVSRAADPAKYWFALGLYGVVGVGALGLVVWGVRVARRG